MFHKYFVLFFLLCMPSFCFSQASVSRSASASVMVYSYMSLEITTNGFLDFKFNNSQQLLDGITFPNRFNTNISSNKNWILNVSTLTSNFLSLGPDASNQMPPSILSIKKSTSDNFLPLSNNPSMVTLGYRGDQTSSGNQFKMDIKATPGYSFDGGAYAIVLLFTLSSQ